MLLTTYLFGVLLTEAIGNLVNILLVAGGVTLFISSLLIFLVRQETKKATRYNIIIAILCGLALAIIAMFIITMVISIA